MEQPNSLKDSFRHRSLLDFQVYPLTFYTFQLSIMPMSIFNLRLLDRFIPRSSTAANQEPSPEYTERPLSPAPEDAPPSYAAALETQMSMIQRVLPPRKISGPSLVQRPTFRTKQLRRYLTELVALTLNVDFNDLNAALGSPETSSQTNSILTQANITTSIT
jgi:hypothetical protein